MPPTQLTRLFVRLHFLFHSIVYIYNINVILGAYNKKVPPGSYKLKWGLFFLAGTCQHKQTVQMVLLRWGSAQCNFMTPRHRNVWLSASSPAQTCCNSEQSSLSLSLSGRKYQLHIIITSLPRKYNSKASKPRFYSLLFHHQWSIIIHAVYNKSGLLRSRLNAGVYLTKLYKRGPTAATPVSYTLLNTPHHERHLLMLEKTQIYSCRAYLILIWFPPPSSLTESIIPLGESRPDSLSLALLVQQQGVRWPLPHLWDPAGRWAHFLISGISYSRNMADCILYFPSTFSKRQTCLSDASRSSVWLFFFFYRPLNGFDTLKYIAKPCQLQNAHNTS